MTPDQLKGMSDQCGKTFDQAMAEHAAGNTVCDGKGALSRAITAMHDQISGVAEFLFNGFTGSMKVALKEEMMSIREELRKDVEAQVAAGIAAAQNRQPPSVTLSGREFVMPAWVMGLAHSQLFWRVVFTLLGSTVAYKMFNLDRVEKLLLSNQPAAVVSTNVVSVATK